MNFRKYRVMPAIGRGVQEPDLVEGLFDFLDLDLDRRLM